MGRILAIRKMLVVASLALLAPALAMADEDQMSVTFKETGPVRKIVKRIRPSEYIPMRGEARLYREIAKRDASLDRKLNRTPASKSIARTPASRVIVDQAPASSKPMINRAPANQQIAKK